MLFNNVIELKKESSEYPEKLKEIKNVSKLYCSGNISLLNKFCFAVVGSRRPSNYGKQVAFDIVEQLVDAGFIIVSGIAPGIDTIAHQIVIKKKAETIAVLGTGIDKKNFYPKVNLKLAEEIIANDGLIISEYSKDTVATKWTFPQRNRIISGISLAVLVIEANVKSGSLITANYGFSQNKKVFAIPNSIYNQKSKGCNLLIKNGAKLVENIDDILNEFQKLNLNFKKKKREIKAGTKEEQVILDILKNESLDLEKIREKSHLSAAEIMIAIANLEIDDKIQDLGNNIYSIKS